MRRNKGTDSTRGGESAGNNPAATRDWSSCLLRLQKITGKTGRGADRGEMSAASLASRSVAQVAAHRVVI